MNVPLSNLVEELRASLSRRNPSSDPTLSPRYELFYHPNSICSQKVRAVLAHHEIAYAARFVDIASGETYIPNYVRLRLIGCRSVPGPLASSHTGSTSVNSSGCDAAVVPTLVDWGTNEVIVDSKRICLQLDDTFDGSRPLRPAKLASQIGEELEIIDNFPNYQLRVGSPPGGGETPVTKKGIGGKAFGLSKVERCKSYIQENRDDPALVGAYQAKLDKELQATCDLLTPDAMEAVYESVGLALRTLEAKLEHRATWLFGDNVTMADIFWAVQLLRIDNLCHNAFWGEGRLPNIEHYLNALRALPSIQSSVTVGTGGVT